MSVVGFACFPCKATVARRAGPERETPERVGPVIDDWRVEVTAYGDTATVYDPIDSTSTTSFERSRTAAPTYLRAKGARPKE